MLFIFANTSFIIRLKWITKTEHITWPPEYVLHEFLLKSHEKQSKSKSWKRRFRALSKLVYFKTQLSELVECSIEAPNDVFYQNNKELKQVHLICFDSNKGWCSGGKIRWRCWLGDECRRSPRLWSISIQGTSCTEMSNSTTSSSWGQTSLE